MTTTWSVFVDWDADGDFFDSYEDITNFVISANWFLGFRKAYQEVADDSRLELILNNTDRRFSPEYNGSEIGNNVLPHREVRVMSYENGTPRVQWRGWIESIEPSANKQGDRQARIMAGGAMQFCVVTESQLPLQENERTSKVIGDLLATVTMPAVLNTNLDTGKVKLAFAADNWVRQGTRYVSRDTFNVMQAVAAMTQVERGKFFFDRMVTGTFWNRHQLLDDGTSLLTLDNTMTELAYQYAGLEYFKNEITVSCRPRTVSASLEVLWQLPEPITISANSSEVITVKYTDGSDNRVAAKGVVVDNYSFETGGGTITLATSANSAKITITNASTTKDVVLLTLVLKGKLITDYDAVEAIATGTASINLYGRRTMSLNLSASNSYEDARQIAFFELERRKSPRGMVQAVTLVSHATQGGDFHSSQLALTIGNRITIKEYQTNHGGSSGKVYFIIGEAHRLSNLGQTLETTWYLEPAPETFPWKLGVSGRSNVGNSTLLTY